MSTLLIAFLFAYQILLNRFRAIWSTTYVTFSCGLLVRWLMRPVIWLRSWFSAVWDEIGPNRDRTPSLHQIAVLLFGHFWVPTVANAFASCLCKVVCAFIPCALWNIDPVSRRCLSFVIWSLLMTNSDEQECICVNSNQDRWLDKKVQLMLWEKLSNNNQPVGFLIRCPDGKECGVGTESFVIWYSRRLGGRVRDPK